MKFEIVRKSTKEDRTVAPCRGVKGDTIHDKFKYLMDIDTLEELLDLQEGNEQLLIGSGHVIEIIDE